MIKFLNFAIYLILLFSIITFSQTNYKEIGYKIDEYFSSRNITKPDTLVFIDISLQKLFFITDTIIQKQYEISSAQAGASFFAELRSNKTPLGLHKIESKIGDSLPIGNIIKMKKILDSVGIIFRTGDIIPSDIEDIIMTRVLVLEGSEKGINKGKSSKGKIIDTFYRGVYIHGTNNEADIGKTNSHGCIRMRNNDIVELYEMVNLTTVILLL